MRAVLDAAEKAIKALSELRDTLASAEDDRQLQVGDFPTELLVAADWLEDRGCYVAARALRYPGVNRYLSIVEEHAQGWVQENAPDAHVSVQPAPNQHQLIVMYVMRFPEERLSDVGERDQDQLGIVMSNGVNIRELIVSQDVGSLVRERLDIANDHWAERGLYATIPVTIRETRTEAA